jgi:acetyltransferase-like isoleucine patch superfamily enzyme
MRFPIFSKLRSLLIFGPACGKNTYVDKSVQFIGSNNIQIGNNSAIGERSWFVVNDRSDQKKTIKIGDNCFIGRDNFFSCGKSIIISDYCLTTQGCRFISSTHIVSNPLKPYLLSGTTNHEKIYIGTNCFFGVDARVIGNVIIGHGSIIGSSAIIKSDIPPFSIVTGKAGVITKRFSFIKNAWIKVDEFSEEDEFSLPSEEQYKISLRRSWGNINMPLIAVSSVFGSI